MKIIAHGIDLVDFPRIEKMVEDLERTLLLKA
jgi:phosphopantetheinyl transferase (holo-ACP synthase)